VSGAGSGDGKGSGPPTLGPPPVQIDYPTYYTFKAMGLAGNVRERMLELIAGVIGPVDPGSVTVRPSSAGKYESVTAHVYLKSEEERRRIYEAFHGALTVEKLFVWYV
jgi:putative lipoic acid-binding regulatory protein